MREIWRCNQEWTIQRHWEPHSLNYEYFLIDFISHHYFFFSTVQGDSLLIDSSTIDPAVSQEMSALALGKSCNYVDAPVSGGKDTLIDQSLCTVCLFDDV